MHLYRYLLTAQLVHRFLQQPHVHVESDRGYMPVLLTAEDVACASQLEIQRRDPESRAEIAELFQRGQTLPGHFAQLGVLRHQQIRICPPIGPSHAAAQLIELREAIPFGVLDDHRVCQRDVQPVLHDGGAHEHVVFVAHEAEQHALQLRFTHLSVAYAYAAVRQQLLNHGCTHEDGVHAVVHEIHLAAAAELLVDGAADQLRIEWGDDGVNGEAVLGGRLDHRHVANTQQRHVQGARNRGGAHGEHVHVFTELLQPLLVTHAKTLFLVDDQKPQIAEFHVFRQQPVGADHHVHLTGSGVLEHLFHLLGGDEAAEHFHPHGERGEAPPEGLEVLERKHGGGSENRHLLAVAERLEGRAHGHFGLAVPDVAAQQAVHGMLVFHVALDLLYGIELVFGGCELEGVLEFALPVRIR